MFAVRRMRTLKSVLNAEMALGNLAHVVFLASAACCGVRPSQPLSPCRGSKPRSSRPAAAAGELLNCQRSNLSALRISPQPDACKKKFTSTLAFWGRHALWRLWWLLSPSWAQSRKSLHRVSHHHPGRQC